MSHTAIRLGVNIDHVATLRQARHTLYPSLSEAVKACERAGAHGITLHLREDRRHIQDDDVHTLRRVIATRMNLEMANSSEILAVALAVRPDEVCLVPERRAELTTEGGLDVAGQSAALAPTIRALSKAGVMVSLFIDPDAHQVEAAAASGAPCIELHTGAFCEASGEVAATELARLTAAARQARKAGLQVNAGHGLHLDNVAAICALPGLDTLNIGHSIICHAVLVGLEAAVCAMLARIRSAG